MYKNFGLFLVMLLILPACGGGSNKSIEVPNMPEPSNPEQSRVRVTDTKMWNSNDCIFYTNEGYALPVFSGDTTEIEYADEVLRITCTYEYILPDITLEDIDLYENIESLVLGKEISGMRIGSLDKLSKLQKLKSLDLNSPFGNPSPDFWKQLTLENLKIVQGIPEINQITTLKSLKVKTFDLEGVKNLSILPNLEELSVHFGHPEYIDISFLEDMNNLKNLTIGIYPDDIYDFFPGYSSELSNMIEVQNIEVLSNLSDLEKLTIWYLPVVDQSIFSRLENLKDLSLNEFTLSDVSSFRCGNNLQSLHFSYNKALSEPSFDESCNSLVEFSARNTSLSEINSLTNMTKLKILDLQGNGISNFDFLSNMSELEELNLNGNPIQDSSISLILNLSKLRILSIGKEFINNSSAFSDSQLEELSLNGITNDSTFDFSSLVCGDTLTKLELESNNIKSISLNSSCENLLNLSLYNNDISDLIPLTLYTNLKELTLSYNKITDVSPLFTLQKLNDIDILSGQNISIEDKNALSSATGALVH